MRKGWTPWSISQLSNLNAATVTVSQNGCMSKYLFEVVRNGQALGDAWVDLDSWSEVRREALKALHDIAIDEMAASSDLDKAMTVSVHNEAGKLVYSATISVSQSFPVSKNPH